jgi:hypothetical protein
MYQPHGRYSYTYGVVRFLPPRIVHSFALSTKHFTELARGRRSAGICAADPSRSHQQHQRKGAHRHRWQTPIQYCVLTWGEWAHNFRNLESESSTPESKFRVVHPGVDCLLHILEAIPCARNDARTRDSGQGGTILRRREQRRRREEGPRSRGRGKSHIDTPDILKFCIEYSNSTDTFCDYAIPLNWLIEIRTRLGSNGKRMRVRKYSFPFQTDLRQHETRRI